MSVDLTQEKEWTYRKRECARYSVEIDDLDFELEVEVEGAMVKCTSVPKPVSYGAEDAIDWDNNRKTWWVASQPASAGGDNFATVVRIDEKVDAETNKISEKYVISTLQHEDGFEDEIELVLWNNEIDAEEGDRVYVSAVGLSSFKGEKYLSVAGYSDICILDESMTAERISEYCRDAEKAVEDDFDRDTNDASDDDEQEGLDAFTPTSVS
ncbi:hypothetical protein Har1130_03635 [Haloarcula sp. CBA1130]|uniref:hypothetical protein n=1 Tax=unclassified Haloarcula TaxID=2624677 RepID=UPI00124592B8|nr:MULTISPECIES: hypothetical protein [unclassified Haloarcula]KAA9398530.1 hypothetical protein Har1129_10020 [Haloarcula sp. CBA1129]KAA9401878.1 hypothetical protein Har1130_03635 [Haloarcula sp. CBA1130]